MSDTNTKYQSEITCPFCGYKDRDSWEVDFGPGLDGEAEIECSRCEKTMIVERSVEVSYTTKKPK